MKPREKGRPKVLFADEPTGNLDAASGQRIVELLEELNRAEHTTVVLVTHDLALASRAQEIIKLRDGRLDGTPEERTASKSSEMRGEVQRLER